MIAPAVVVAASFLAPPPARPGDADAGGLRFLDVTRDVGLGDDVIGNGISRALFADVNGDGRPDAVIRTKVEDAARETFRPRVFLNVPDDRSPVGVRFQETPFELTGLPELFTGDLVVFADLDNDTHADAVVTRWVDANKDGWDDHGERTAWLKGRGDGTFGAARPIEAATPATTAAVAIGDADRNGRLDLWIGNWYHRYGASLDGHHNDLLLRQEDGTFARVGFTDGYSFHPDDAEDRGGRPTYGVMIAELFREPMMFRGEPVAQPPQLLELNYGRRWNRLYDWDLTRLSMPPVDLRPSAEHALWHDIAPRVGLDGDAVRHGEYPAWAVERMAEREPPIELEPEKPFRSNGNTFDAAVGDVDNDGDWDLFLAEITHGWAGESSDRSRFLINNGERDGAPRFETDPRRSVDRIPPDRNNWNQGDLFAELADFNHDTRLDLLLSSGDYPDDQRLRLFLQREDGSFEDATAAVALDHDGSQQISLGDVDGDGALDIMVGQTFFRYTPEMKAGREPRLRVFVSRFDPALEGEASRSVTLRLEGDPSAGTNRDALGAIVTARVGDVSMRRQLVGVGGHAGKQHQFLIHFGLGEAPAIDELVVTWPNRDRSRRVLTDVKPGRYTLRQGGTLEPERDHAKDEHRPREHE